MKETLPSPPFPFSSYLDSHRLVRPQELAQRRHHLDSSAIVRPRATTINDTHPQTLIRRETILGDQLASRIPVGRAGDTAEIQADGVHGQGDQPRVDIGGDIIVGHDQMDGDSARQGLVGQLDVRLLVVRVGMGV